MKEYWKMTREEFQRPVRIPQDWKQKGYTAVIQRQSAEPGRKGPVVIAKMTTPEGETLYRSGPHEFDFVRAKYKDVHREIVQKALELGKPVPSRVLADYPVLHFVHEMKELLKKRESLSDNAFIRQQALVRKAIRERESGVIKELRDLSLTDLRKIQREINKLER